MRRQAHSFIPALLWLLSFPLKSFTASTPPYSFFYLPSLYSVTIPHCCYFKLCLLLLLSKYIIHQPSWSLLLTLSSKPPSFILDSRYIQLQREWSPILKGPSLTEVLRMSGGSRTRHNILRPSMYHSTMSHLVPMDTMIILTRMEEAGIPCQLLILHWTDYLSIYTRRTMRLSAQKSSAKTMTPMTIWKSRTRTDGQQNRASRGVNPLATRTT